MELILNIYCQSLGLILPEPIYVLAIAIALDLLLNDPQTGLHPVCLIGGLIAETESLIQRVFVFSLLPDRLKGVFIALISILIPFSICIFLICLCYSISEAMGTIASSIILWSTLGLTTLYKEVARVLNAIRYLNKGEYREYNIKYARKLLARIVGRDTTRLDVQDIARSLIETLSENFVDAFLAPLIFWCIGGTSLAVLYRSANTLDAMLGYKNEKYINLGWASAKADDILNLVPARICPVIVSIASFVLNRDFAVAINIIKNAFKEGKKHESPNSGIAEASFAIGLDVRLGGPTAYKEEGIKERPYINPGGDAPDIIHVKNALMLYSASAIASIIILPLLFYLIQTP